MSTKNKRYSFEFFPPRTEEGKKKLIAVRNELNTLNPAFFSVTYGAGGSTRDNTKGIVLQMIEDGIDAAPHLSFGADEEETIEALLNEYKDAGIKRIVALRGDIPSGMGAMRLIYARELVEFIHKKTGDHFEIEVAAYPEIHPDAPSYSQDVEYLKQKLDAGANSAITQYFFSTDAYLYFVDQCQKAGIDKPIYPGIMPITNYDNIARFSKVCGADIPRWMCERLESYNGDLESIRAFGTEVITRMCERLLAAGAPGLHFYTMNQVEPNKTIWNNLGLS